MPTNTSAGRAKAVRKAATAASETATVTEITLRNGVVLGIKAVPMFLIRRAGEGVPKPKPPTFYNETTKRDEDNLLSAEWEEAKQAWEEEKSEVSANVMLIAGTWVKTIPKNVATPESSEWLDIIELMRIPVELHCWKCADKSPEPGCSGCEKARYLSWLNLYAIESMTEWAAVLSAVTRLAGISEEEIGSALESFRRGTKRGADNGSSPADTGNGNHVSEEPAESST